MEVILLKPSGYCGGVMSAIKSASEIRNKTTQKIYVFGLLVHNELVKEYLDSLNIITIDTTSIDKIKRLNEFKEDEVVLFTAHGHNKEYEDILKKNNVTFYDLTCPYVNMNMNLLLKRCKDKEVIFIGKKGHPETEAALSLSNKVVLYDIKEGIDYSKINCDNPSIVNQTTLSLLEIEEIYKDIKEHIPGAIEEDEICLATRRRQENILSLNDEFDLFVVIGSIKSSNTDKLYQIAKGKFADKTVIKVNSVAELKEMELSTYKKTYVTSGTSTPPELINNIVKYLEEI